MAALLKSLRVWNNYLNMEKSNMRLRLLKIIFTLIFFQLISYSNAFAIITQGCGNSKKSAKSDALRNAIEQEIGPYISSKTNVSMGKLVSDIISTESVGYVKHANILDITKHSDNSFCVSLDVLVDGYKIKNVVEEYIKDPLARKTFVNMIFDNRRIIVMYNQHMSKISYNSKTANTIMNLVQDKLREYSFQVFLQNQLKRIRNQIIDHIINEKNAIELAQQERADAVVLISTDLNTLKKANGSVIYLKIDLKAFDITTGELFAYVREKENDIHIGTIYNIEDASARIAEKIAPIAVEKLVKKIVKQFTENRSKFTVFIFQNLNLELQDQIIDLLHEMSWDYKIESQFNQYLELSIYSEEAPSDLRQHFRMITKKHGIYLKSISFKGARVIFSGK